TSPASDAPVSHRTLRRLKATLRNVADIDFIVIAIRLQLTPAAIGRDALLRHPHALRLAPGLPEHVDGNAAARIPVAADAEPFQAHRAIARRGRVAGQVSCSICWVFST